MRGAAPIILATFPLVAGLESASLIFNVVFFVVLASVTLQGTTISFASRRLGLIDDTQAADRTLLPRLMDQGNFQDNLLEINLDTHCSVIGRQVLDLNLPPDVLLMLIHRQGEVVVPRGATRLEQNDRLLLLTTPETRESVVSLLTT
jgi:cell volume regulation protein A